MFQKFKSALDAIAEDQARQRTPQPPNRTSQSTRRSISRIEPSSGRHASRLSGDDDKLQNLSGTDPDPSTFDGDFVIGEDDAHSRTTTPKPNPRGNDNHADDGNSMSGAVGHEQPAEEPADRVDKVDTTELPSDVTTKLKKLNKLESKYQELLRAYRKAHARNSLIEPFEARLREVTPLASIADPNALVEYLQQVNLRGEMAMEELKKVSGEKEDLRQKLRQSEQKLKASLEETTLLRNGSARKKEAIPDVTAEGREDVSTQKDRGKSTSPSPHNADTLESTKTSPKPVSSLLSLARNKPDVTRDESEEFFSVESEVPRLETEIQDRDQKISVLAQHNTALESDLAGARESAQQMMQNLETVQSDLESLRTTRENEREEMRERIETLQHSNTVLSTRLNGETENNHESTSLEKAEEAKLLAIEAGVTQERVVRETDHETDFRANIVPGESEAPRRSLKEIERAFRQEQELTKSLTAKIRDQEDLIEEIEQLREELVNLGQEHVTAKDHVQSLSLDNSSLKQKVQDLEQEVEDLHSRSTDEEKASNGSDLQTRIEELTRERDAMKEERDSLSALIEASKNGREEPNSKDITEVGQIPDSGSQTSLDELRTRLGTVHTDLSAAQQLATSRFKEISSLKDLIQKAQPELASLRTEVSELRGLKEELQVKSSDMRKLESRSENLRAEGDNLRRKVSAKDAEINSLNQKLSLENSRRLSLEESQRRTQREVQRLQNEKMEALSIRDSAEKQRSELEKELNEARPRLRQLQEHTTDLDSELERLKEEISLKTAQHASAQSLMTSVRDQASEMASQMKESKERCESLEEELADAHRLMNERGREGETMRRLLADVEARANTRVKEMRERMEHAIQERDRAEEEASNSARRKGRELDELKVKLRNVERDLKLAWEDKAEIEKVEKDLRHQRDEEQHRVEQATQEVSDVRKAMSELRDALDEGERQAKELEHEKNDARKTLEDVQVRLEKLQMVNKTITEELKTIRNAKSKQLEAPSSRSSDSSLTSKEAAQSKRTLETTGKTQPPVVDFVYLKTVLLQFLEQKDKTLQRQLVPVLGMLLRFDKSEEQKWITAVNSR